MTEKLKPCPMCSSDKIGGVHDTVYCDECGLKITKPRPLANAIAAWNRRAEPAGSADQVNDAVEMVDDSPGIVWKVTFLDGSSCHYGVKSTAQAAARGCGTVEAIELKDKRFRLVEACSSAMSTQSTHLPDVSIKAGEIDIEKEREAFEKWFDAWRKSTWCVLPSDPRIECPEHWNTGAKRHMEIAWQARALLAAKGGE